MYAVRADGLSSLDGYCTRLWRIASSPSGLPPDGRWAPGASASVSACDVITALAAAQAPFSTRWKDVASLRHPNRGGAPCTDKWACGRQCAAPGMMLVGPSASREGPQLDSDRADEKPGAMQFIPHPHKQKIPSCGAGRDCSRPGGIRTPNSRIKSPLLYQVELRACRKMQEKIHQALGKVRAPGTVGAPPSRLSTGFHSPLPASAAQSPTRPTRPPPPRAA